MTRSAWRGLLGGQRPPDLHPGRVQSAAADRGVRPGQVDVLEQAHLGRGRREPARPHAPLVQGDQLAGLDLAHEGGADDVERRGLARHHPAAGQLPDDERPEALRVAGRVQRVLVHEDERVGAAHQRQDAGRGLLDTAVVAPRRRSARSARRCPRSPAARRTRSPRAASRPARGCWSGCRCARARSTPLASTGTSAARWPIPGRPSSSSGSARPRCRRAAR